MTVPLDRLLDRLPDHERTALPPTIERVTALAAALDNPQRAFPSIHVTGTNGKGSTVAMIAALLATAGLRVGTYTSPHLRDVTERICIEGRPVDGLELEWALAEVTGVAERLGEPPTWFEAMTLAAFMVLKEARVAAAVVEVGMLGRWDATNVIDGRVAVITNVGLDHTDYAGPTAADIAWEKAGIIRPGSPLILGRIDPALRSTFEAERPSVTRELGRDFPPLDVGMPGHRQRSNAALARAAVEAFLEAPLEDALVGRVLAEVRIPGRFEQVPTATTTFILDGAHNPAAAESLRCTLNDVYPRPRRRILVCGALAGRDLEAFLRGVGVDAGEFDAVIMTAPDSPRAVGSVEAAQVAADVGGAPVRAALNVGSAIDVAADLAGPEGVVVVTGSLYLIDPARCWVAACL